MQSQPTYQRLPPMYQPMYRPRQSQGMNPTTILILIIVIILVFVGVGFTIYYFTTYKKDGDGKDDNGKKDGKGKDDNNDKHDDNDKKDGVTDDTPEGYFLLNAKESLFKGWSGAREDTGFTIGSPPIVQQPSIYNGGQIFLGFIIPKDKEPTKHKDSFIKLFVVWNGNKRDSIGGTGGKSCLTTKELYDEYCGYGKQDGVNSTFVGWILKDKPTNHKDKFHKLWYAYSGPQCSINRLDPNAFITDVDVNNLKENIDDEYHNADVYCQDMQTMGYTKRQDQ
jgi:hypothetical protein